ncbi:hypothetical protein SAMN02745898_10874 [Streptomyces sp. 136MFCol5.1]|uniref:DUF6571 family protein n=1 Tax=unclassified Streptomyces TaxID=2593676 RepID=UPI000887884C|nr:MULTISPECIES: DUF6571 family protein [unclassified Streptomyces]SCZ06615.1 hypothetical protein SAMN02745898_10874 [Streptomyces sp. 136MFCol5.1]SFT18345.1 hypothetical protein SAMN04487982_10977 [Streptomyces sp. ok210]
MLTYENLLHVDLAQLSEAVAKWRNLPGQFKTIARKYENTVEKGLWDYDWEGEAANAARTKLGKVKRQIDAASEEATDIHLLFDDALHVFKSSQKKLKGLRDQIEQDKYLSIKPDGEVWFDAPADTPIDDLAALRKGYQESIIAYRESIRSCLTAADEADDTLSWVLSQDGNGRERGFDAHTYRSIKEAKQGRAAAEKDLAALTELASARTAPDAETLTRINSLLKKHEGDPYFTERFATRLGPKKTLEFWTRIADRRQTGDERTKISAQIQKSLSRTLATASHSDSAAMERWKRQMVALGDDRVQMVDMGAATVSDGPYGYQVMSSLMRTGEYDKDFLTDYGRSLIDFEKDHKSTKLKDLWQPDGYETYLNFGPGTDHGLDPMAGYMDALGHNPDAAKTMFFSKDWGPHDKTDPDLQYLLKDREWPNGNWLVDNKRGYGYDELGHALEAATLGVPYDRPELGLRRDDTTANVMEQVVRLVGNDQGLVADKPGIGNSLAKMGAGYIDDLNWSVANFSDGDGGRASRDAAFGHLGEGHTFLKHDSALSFLQSVGQHEGGYEILSQAQEQYTVSGLKAHPNPDDELKMIIESGAKTHGILDQSRVTEIDHEYGEKTDEANRKLAEAAEWKKFGIGQGIGVGVGLATLPFGGPAAATGAAAVAQFAVPLIIEGAGGAIETDQGIEIDRELAKQEADFDREEEVDKREFVGLGRKRAGAALDAYIAVHPEVDDTAWWKEVRVGVERGYTNGDTEADQTDAD